MQIDVVVSLPKLHVEYLMKRLVFYIQEFERQDDLMEAAAEVFL